MMVTSLHCCGIIINTSLASASLKKWTLPLVTFQLYRTLGTLPFITKTDPWQWFCGDTQCAWNSYLTCKKCMRIFHLNMTYLVLILSARDNITLRSAMTYEIHTSLRIVIICKHSQTFRNNSTTSIASNLYVIVRINTRWGNSNIVRYGRSWTVTGSWILKFSCLAD